MTTTSHISTDRAAVYSDLNGLQDIRKLDRKDSKQAMGAIGKQFESMFTSMMLKSMREANKGFEDGNIGHGQESEFYRDMFDQQLALSLSHGKGIGLADTLTRQLQMQYKKGSSATKTALDHAAGSAVDAGRNVDAGKKMTALDRQHQGGMPLPGNGDLQAGKAAQHTRIHMPAVAKNARTQDDSEKAFVGKPEAIEFAAATAGVAADTHDDWLKTVKVVSDVHYASPRVLPRSAVSHAAAADDDADTAIGKPPVFASQEDFVNHLLPIIREHAEPRGLDARAILAQAALETGWGKHVIRDDNGKNSFNLFGIKSGSNWGGDVAQVQTTEYYGGKVVHEDAGFRSYRSYADSVRDYVKLIAGSDNYRNAVKNAAAPKDYFRSLQKSGYATDPRYAEKLWNIYNSDVMQTTAVDNGNRAPQSVRALQIMSAVQGAMNVSAATADNSNRG